MQSRTIDPILETLSPAEIARLDKMTMQKIDEEIDWLDKSAQAHFAHAAMLQAFTERQRQSR